jgi:hypothetical protein
VDPALMRKPPESLVPDHAPLRQILAEVQNVDFPGSLEQLHDFPGTPCDQFLQDGTFPTGIENSHIRCANYGPRIEKNLPRKA